jgi:hypothetical protein
MSSRLRRIRISEAMEILGVSKMTLERLLSRDLFTVQKDGSENRCQRYLFLDEIETYIEANANGTGKEGEMAVLALRIEKRRKRKR